MKRWLIIVRFEERNASNDLVIFFVSCSSHPNPSPSLSSSLASPIFLSFNARLLWLHLTSFNGGQVVNNFLHFITEDQLFYGDIICLLSTSLQSSSVMMLNELVVTKRDGTHRRERRSHRVFADDS